MEERKIDGGVIVGLLECDLNDEPKEAPELPVEEKPKRAGRKKAE